MTKLDDNERSGVVHRRANPSTPLLLMGIALVIVLGILLVPFFQDTETTTVDTGATANEIVRNPDGFANKVVTVSGEVDRVIDSRSIVLGGRRFIGGDELLVVCVTPMPAPEGRRSDRPVEARDILLVSGSVRRFNLASVEKEAGIDLEDALFDQWVDRPVIVARLYHITPRAPRSLAD